MNTRLLRWLNTLATLLLYLFGAFLGLLYVGLLIILPAFFIGLSSMLISLPVWLVAYTLLDFANSSYLPEQYWDGYWICTLAMFIVLVIQRLTRNTSKEV